MSAYIDNCLLARATEGGDNWRHRKTGKTLIILRRVGFNKVEVLHESGRKTTKQDNYLASDYEYVSPNQT